MRMKISTRSTALACGGVLLLATAALAGSGVGGVFNLGQTNTVNARTQLQGTASTQSLRVVNSSTAAGSVAVAGQADRGTGVLGSSASRIGVRALATNASGVNYGIYATTASRGGLAGYFQNAGTTSDPALGAGIRALAAGASASILNFPRYAGGGEFIGPNGLIGISSEANLGSGVVGYAGAGDFGVFGVSGAADGFAGFFQNTNTDSSQTGTALRAISEGSAANIPSDRGQASAGEFVGFAGVTAVGNPAQSGSTGVAAYARGVNGVGVFADGAAYGVWSKGHARVDGNLAVGGTLTKGAGTFKIDHPLDPANRYLSHSFVESPDMMNIYNGNVVTDAQGVAVVELPSYFEALNREPRYQLTVIGLPVLAYVAEEIADGRFTIRTEEPNVKVSWQVTGIRQDAYAEAHPVVVEEEKAVADRGFYLAPEEHGQPASMGIGAHVAAQANTPSVQ